MQRPDPDGRLSPSAVLTILADSLGALSTRIASIEACAARLASAAPRTPDVTAALQDLDLVRQTTEDLARLAAAAAGGEAQPAATLAGVMRLEALRDRVHVPSAAAPPHPERRSDPGELDLFAGRAAPR